MYHIIEFDPKRSTEMTKSNIEHLTINQININDLKQLISYTAKLKYLNTYLCDRHHDITIEFDQFPTLTPSLESLKLQLNSNVTMINLECLLKQLPKLKRLELIGRRIHEHYFCGERWQCLIQMFLNQLIKFLFLFDALFDTRFDT
ncbi:unnamed protein product [Didymodactylos carnosus]|uniref:Uncharacterized protein n=1 Tax=Didymodactylos carnosus TaxID=1234261 RepID=A0A815UQ79_9BILA|nr:unnamed protein product [Didymodactylos carnosus]CAF1519204.1 unnamed protein product [Didymodactylos carnosus]CAF4051588.1 unnamed protein product [Didymodactylos carnosus]CAF4378854.1 unnamed protein product [Didymodactylos carnosus]